MPAIPAIIAGGAALGSALIAHAGKKSSFNQSTTPQMTPQQQQLFGPLSQSAISGLSQTLPPGYESAGIQSINQNSSLGDMMLKNRLTALGLSNSPVAANAALTSGINKTGQLNQFETYTLPTMQNQFQNQKYNQALSLFGSLPSGSATSGTGVNSGMGAAGSVGAGIGSLAQMLAYMQGMGTLGGSQQAPAVSGVPQSAPFDFSALAPILAQQQAGNAGGGGASGGY